MSGLLRVTIVLLLGCVACTSTRELGPQVTTCAEISTLAAAAGTSLKGAATAVCADDIVARCVAGEVVYDYCFARSATCDPAQPAAGCSDASTAQPVQVDVQIAEVVLLDADNDGLIEPGEAFSLDVYVRNEGKSSTPELAGTLTSTSPGACVVDLQSALGYAPIATATVAKQRVKPADTCVAGAACPGSAPLAFQVAAGEAACPKSSYMVQFKLAMQPAGASGPTVSRTFQLPVAAP